MTLIARAEGFNVDSELNDRVTAVIGFDLSELTEAIRKAGIDYGRQKAYVEQLEHSRKVCLATAHENIRREMNERGEKTSETMLDTKARASQDYKRFLDDLKIEKVKLQELEAEYYALRNKREDIHAQIQFARSEMFSLDR